MFDEVQEIDGKKEIKKIRSRFLKKEEKVKKKAEYEKMMFNKQFLAYKLTNDLCNILQYYIPNALILYEYKRSKYEIPERKKLELSTHLIIDNF